jgi:isoleucyl-tRNA synthetase
LNQVVAQVTDNFENSDAYTATVAFETLLYDLSNWYVRRSRRRFWKSEQDSDKNTAYATLWHVLVKMSRALAPILPFITEVMYQNLIRGVTQNAFESVHHTDWPRAETQVVDSKQVYQMDLARRVASLGLSARGNAGLKVRQPLAKALAHVSEGQAELSDELVEIVADELNVKSFEFVDDPGVLVNYRVLPVNELLGPKFGADFPKVRAALTQLDSSTVAAKVADGETVGLQIDGKPVSLAPDEVLINTEPVEGLAVAADRLLTVAVDAVLTPELKSEGLAREIVRRVQAQRKEADFNIEDRIITWYVAGDDLAEVFNTWGEYIQAETLTTSLIPGEPPEDAYVETHAVDGVEFTIGIKQRS